MRSLEGIHPGWGIFVVRVMAGIIIAKAGLDKLPNVQGFSGYVGQLGLPAPELLGPFIVALELIGGLLLLIGLGTRWVAILFVIEYLTTTFYVKLPRPAPAGGWDSARIDMMLLATAIMLILAGPGKAAVDNMLRRRRSEAAVA